MRTTISILLFFGFIFLTSQSLEHNQNLPVTVTNGDVTFSGDLKYNFIHCVGVTDTCNYTPTVTQWAYTRINTSSTTGGLRWEEADGVTCVADSIKILKAGDYFVHFSITLSGTNANDYWRIRVHKNGYVIIPTPGRFRFKTVSNNQSDTRSYFWYLMGLSANDVISFWITNESASRNPTIVDIKIYMEKKPE